MLALEKEKELLEVESQSLREQLGHSGDQQKGKTLGLALLVLSVLRCLTMMYNARDGARPFPREHQVAHCGKGGNRGKYQEGHRRS